MDLSRSIHPDLLEEYEQAQAAPPAETPKRQRRGRGAAVAADVSPPGDAPTSEPTTAAPTEGSEETAASEPTAPTPSAAPEWLAQLKATSEPREMLALLTRNMAREDLSRDDVLAGLIGDLGNRRARQMLEDADRQRADRARADAYDKGDLYTLGQLTAAELQAQRQQSQAARDPYMVAIHNFQAALPEAVQLEVQGKNYDSFGAYLSAVQDAAIRHGVQEEVKKRSSAIDKANLSQTVGSEPSPELDGGPALRTREITGAQVAAMTLEEYDRYFDEKNRPRAGVIYRPSDRDIDVRHESSRR